jgi:hypothetical protein
MKSDTVVEWEVEELQGMAINARLYTPASTRCSSMVHTVYMASLVKSTISLRCMINRNDI